MATLGASDRDPKCDHCEKRHAVTEDSLFSTRSFLILGSSAAIGLLVGLGVGVSAWIAAIAAVGSVGAAVLGVVAGLGSALLAGLSVAKRLHALLGGTAA
jgi:hypothetical protein